MSEHQLRQQAKVRNAFEVRQLLAKIAARIGEFIWSSWRRAHADGLFFLRALARSCDMAH
jgi:hypothetical protein